METIPGRAHVPSIDDATLHALTERIKPVVRNEEGVLHYIAEVDPRRIVWTWDPVLQQPAENLVEMGRFESTHACAYHGFFKPTIDEVMAQLPKDAIEECVAFETLTDEILIYEGGDGHLATTVLYKAAPANA